MSNMVRYLPIYNCIYCHHRQLLNRKDEKYKHDPYCCHGDGKPKKIEQHGFESSVPYWCPLPTAMELLVTRMR